MPQPSFWRDKRVLGGRRDALLSEPSTAPLDGLLITSDSDRAYLTGYLAESHDAIPTAVLLVGSGRSVLLTSPNNVEWAANDSPGTEVVPWTRPWWSTLAGHIVRLGWASVGFQADHLTTAGFRELSTRLGDRVALRDLDLSGRLRSIKDEGEIATIRRAVEITDRAFIDASAELTAGQTERELAWSLDIAMHRHGASGPGFPTIVASGPNAARPHHAPSGREIRPGEPVIIDMGARFDGYTADLTRTIWLGDPDPKLIGIYRTVADANLAARLAVRDGVAARDVDRAARAIIADAGYADAFVHGVGHGVGLDIHEAPSAGARSDDVLATGQSLTIEPGIYLPGWGGVRIEDLGMVTDDGFDRLTQSPTR